MIMMLLEKVTCICLNVSVWTGAKKLRPEDFKGVSVPPEEIVSLGQKKTHDKTALKGFSTLKMRAVRYLDGIGTTILGGKVWAIPEHELEGAIVYLEELKGQFEVAKQIFISEFYQVQEDWLEKNAEWASILRPYLESVSSVQGKFSFLWQTFKMAQAEDEADLEESVKSDMVSNIMKDISRLAREFSDATKEMKESVPQKSLGRLHRLVKKLEGLSFTTSAASMVAAELRELLPEEDSIKGMALYKLRRLVIQLSNPKVLEEVFAAAKQGANFFDDFWMEPLEKPAQEDSARDSDIQYQQDLDVQDQPVPVSNPGHSLPDTWF
jgi:hypothetical protein